MAWPALPQFTDMTAPGHGTDLYYALQLRQPVMEAFANASFYASSSTAGPIYRVGSGPPTLFASSPAPVFPPNNTFSTNTPWFISPYYLLSHPQFSRDLGVLAFMGRRICLDGLGCLSVRTTQTTVQSADFGVKTFEGRGWLSGNGRYLLIQPEVSPASSDPPTLIDLKTGQVQNLSRNLAIASPKYGESVGRILADDGTAVLGICAPSTLCILRGGQMTFVAGVSGIQPVIDAGARSVIYTSLTPSGQQYLRVYDVSRGQDKLFVQPNGDTYAPSISSDGTRVMFLSTAQWGTSNPPGAVQLYAINLDGTGFQELTSASEPSGVKQYTMSDDGQVAWYVSGDGKLVRIDLSGGQISRAVFRAAAVDLSGAKAPGSAITLSGAGLSDVSYVASPGTPLSRMLGNVTVNVNGVAAPILSVAPDSIVFQLPWEAPTDAPSTIQVVTNAGAANESTAQAIVTAVASRPSLIPGPFELMYNAGLGGGVIHEDWSGFVTPDRPARPGEVIHLYGTGFGQVEPGATTGVPAPSGTLSEAITKPSCSSELGPAATISYLGLAPGLTGYYQIDVRLPPFFNAGPSSNKTYDQFYIACGTAVTVFAISMPRR